ARDDVLHERLPAAEAGIARDDLLGMFQSQAMAFADGAHTAGHTLAQILAGEGPSEALVQTAQRRRIVRLVSRHEVVGEALELNHGGMVSIGARMRASAGRCL